MNKVSITGRMVKDPEVRYAQNEKATAIARFTLAVNRKHKQEGQPNADFINCVAFGHDAEFIEKYFRKGMKAEVSGRIQTGSYKNKDGQTVYTTDVMVEEIDFGESKQNSNSAPAATTANDGFMSIPDGIEEELPFV